MVKAMSVKFFMLMLQHLVKEKNTADGFYLLELSETVTDPSRASQMLLLTESKTIPSSLSFQST